jgi:cell division protein FtsA
MSGFPHGMTPKMRPLSARKSAIVATLDVGTTKVVCVIARMEPLDRAEAGPGRTHRAVVAGIGQVRARGLKGGIVVDLDEAERSIRAAVDAAERMAGIAVESVIVGMTGGRLGSQHFTTEVGVGGRTIQARDIDRAVGAAMGQMHLGSRAILHALPVGYRLDGNAVRTAEGLVAGKLGVDLHVATCDSAPARNLILAIERCHLHVEAMVATPYASGLATLIDDEAELGSVVVDCGGGTTAIAVFADGLPQHVDAIAIGGRHITMDLARGLGVRLDDAERLKIMASSCIERAADGGDLLTIPKVGDSGETGACVPRAQLTRVVRPRAEEILELVRDRVRAAGFGAALNRGAVLTGAAAELDGFQALAEGILSKSVRIGRPLPIKGMPESGRNPGFATTVGLIAYPGVAARDISISGPSAQAEGQGYFARVGRWLRDSF